MREDKRLNVVITGISRGLGHAMSRSFSKREVQVFGCCLSLEGFDFSGTDYAAGQPRVFQASVCDGQEMQEFARQVQDFGAPDIVIANAGTINIRRPLWEIGDEEWDQVLDVNVKGVLETARSFLPAMLSRGSGLFVAMSSGWGRYTSAGLGPYCASKFAVEGIVGVLNDDLPEGVRAIALDPGNGINTQMLKTCLPDEHMDYIDPQIWAEYAVKDILAMYDSNAAGSLTVAHPGVAA